MNWKSFGLIIAGAIVQAIGVAMLKSTMNSPDKNIISMGLAFVFMIVGFPIYNIGLKKIKLSVAQPLFSATLFLTCTLLSLVVLHEAIYVNQIIGIIIILAGVAIVISADSKNTGKKEVSI